MIRVAVAAEHAESRALFAALPGIDVVASVATAREAASTAADVLVVDLRLPGLDGVLAKGAVLVLSMSEGQEAVFAAMRAGARGYLVRGATQDEIIHAIATVAAGGVLVGPGVARRMLEHLPEQDLTGREREVLGLVAAGLPAATVAIRLGLAAGTVDNHLTAIVAKLHAGS